MSSLIPGYEYDIFISYRQKDNKGDKWVSEFVSALKTELESAFKEDISVYFDINPHNGLLETHDVDASLKEKLKCLVFIPVISRTYCDPKSFAWEHEFKAFVELASQDQFGLKVKLPNGNVANRVLPVRIHDLEIADIKECESVLGGVLRGVEFIYSEPGVNRPLKSNDDEKTNLNKTKYINQINKVANAVREIIKCLKYSDTDGKPVLSENHEKEQSSREVKKIVNRKKFKIGIAVLAILILLTGSLFISQAVLKGRGIDTEREKTIAVLPFLYRSSNASQLWISEEFADEIRGNLLFVRSFSVRPRSSSDLFRDSKKSATEIGNELNANYLVEGSITVDGNNMKMKVNLIDSKSDKTIWTKEYPGELTQILPLVSKVARQIVTELKTELSPEEMERIEKSPTKNPEAFNLYLQGRNLWKKRSMESLKQSIEFYNKALTIDPDYALAYSGLADVYYNMVSTLYMPGNEGYPKAKEYAKKAIAIDNNIPETHITLGALYTWSDWMWEDARNEFQIAIKLNPNNPAGHYNYAVLLQVLGEDEEARTQINIAMNLDPDMAIMRTISSYFYYLKGSYRESLMESEKALEINPVFYGSYVLKFLSYAELNEDLKAYEALMQTIRLDSIEKDKEKSAKEIFNKSGLNGLIKWAIQNKIKPFNNYFYRAFLYSKLGNKDETLICLEKGVEERIYDMPRINNSVQFNNLKNEPRFITLIKKMGLSEYYKPD
jgi:TolB-like protein/tetratricopeptide (TPR) repeat protein